MTAETLAVGRTETPAGTGQIPFRIRIGVTGHRELDHDQRTDEVVRTQVRRIRELLPPSSTDVRLAVVSQLAEGADRLVVREVFAEARERAEDAHLEVVLPVDSDRYPKIQEFSAASREEFERLLERATFRSEPVGVKLSTPDDRAAVYESASQQLIGRCDVLIAIWNGDPTGGRGGTAETLLDAAARSKPCIWVSTDGEPTVRDNLANGSSRAFYRDVAGRAAVPTERESKPGKHPESALQPLRDAFSMLNEYNRERLPRGFEARLEKELASPTGVAEWVAGPFLRATLLAARWQRRFRWLSWLISLFATAAAAMLAVSLSFDHSSPAWRWAEAACLVCALTGVLVVRRGGFHRHWLSYRVLAERLRTAHYLAPTGVDFRRQARLEAVYVGNRSEDWLMRAFEEVWARRPTAPEESLVGDELDHLKRRLADDWIGRQLRYHEERARHHARWHRLLTTAVALLFVATVPFAFLHALHVTEHASTFFTITLPAAGASLGALLTINQHHALSERYARMRSDLTVVRRTLLDANAHTLGMASAEAARVIAQETGAWFGAMWFLDIEHP